jgi:acyl CoA:acetate/3-ketoacid CoA transferase beta subunit
LLRECAPDVTVDEVLAATSEVPLQVNDDVTEMVLS